MERLDAHEARPIPRYRGAAPGSPVETKEKTSMRKRSFLLSAVVAMTALAAAPAYAAPMNVNGTLGVALGTLGGPTLTGSGVGSSAGGVGADFTLPAAFLNLTEPVSVAIEPPALGLSLITVPASAMAPVQNVAGAFGTGTTMFPLGGNLGGVMGNNGLAKLFFQNGTGAGTVPLNYIGGGGMGNVEIAGLPVTVVGAIWSNLGVSTMTPTKVTKITRAAAGIPITITVSAYDKRTAGGEGSVQLIAPANAKLSGGILGTLPVVGILTLEFSVPAPGAFLLFGSALLTLLAIARTRSRH
jgi:hypothetical protein